MVAVLILRILYYIVGLPKEGENLLEKYVQDIQSMIEDDIFKEQVPEQDGQLIAVTCKGATEWLLGNKVGFRIGLSICGGHTELQY